MSEEWTTVTKGNGKVGRKPVVNNKKKGNKLASSNAGLQMGSGDLTLGELEKTIECMKSSSFYCTLLSQLSSLDCIFHSMVGLGIGSFSSASSRLQLALFVCLGRSTLLTRKEGVEEESLLRYCIFDPIMSEADKALCESIGISVLTENNKGKLNNEGRSTLYFMPHCPYRLYCNILWSNWNFLPSTYIIGNSFTSYSLRRIANTTSSTTTTEDLTDSVMRLLPYLQETEVWSSKYNKEMKQVLLLNNSEIAFCDTSLIYLSHKLKKEQSDRLQDVLALRVTEEAIDTSSAMDEELW